MAEAGLGKHGGSGFSCSVCDCRQVCQLHFIQPRLLRVTTGMSPFETSSSRAYQPCHLLSQLHGRSRAKRQHLAKLEATLTLECKLHRRPGAVFRCFAGLGRSGPLNTRIHSVTLSKSLSPLRLYSCVALCLALGNDGMYLHCGL